MTAYKLINVYTNLLSANNSWSTLNVNVIINFSAIFRGLKPELRRCNIYEVPKHRILPEFMTRHGVFVHLCIIYEWKKAFVDVLLLPISSDQTDIVTTEIAGLGKKRSLPKGLLTETGEYEREKICTRASLTKTHTLSPIVAAAQPRDIIYQWTNAGTRMLLLKWNNISLKAYACTRPKAHISSLSGWWIRSRGH